MPILLPEHHPLPMAPNRPWTVVNRFGAVVNRFVGYIMYALSNSITDRHMQIPIYAHTHIHVLMCTYTDIHTYSMHAHTNTRYIWIRIHRCKHTQRYIHMYLHTHMYIQHIYTCTKPHQHIYYYAHTHNTTCARDHTHTQISGSEVREVVLVLIGSKFMQSAFINCYLFCWLTFTIIFIVFFQYVQFYTIIFNVFWLLEIKSIGICSYHHFSA